MLRSFWTRLGLSFVEAWGCGTLGLRRSFPAVGLGLSGLLLGVLSGGGLGCTSAGTLYQVELTLELSLADGSPVLADGGLLHVELHHAYQGEGNLAHPLGLIQAFTVDAAGTVTLESTSDEERQASQSSAPVRVSEPVATGLEPFSVVFDYPLEEGTGLFVYAWEDRDGDDALCSPTEQTELAGGVEVSDFPAHVLEVALTLDALCTGAERLFPPGQP